MILSRRPVKVTLPKQPPRGRQVTGYCPACKLTGLPNTAFVWFKRTGRDKSIRQTLCKNCRNERRRNKRPASIDGTSRRHEAVVRAKLWVLANPDSYRVLQLSSSIRRRYGMTVTQYLALLHYQGYKCARCRSYKWGGKHNRPSVDHDHVTGKVRGMLCTWCNKTLGHLGDTLASVRTEMHSYAAYLEGRL